MTDDAPLLRLERVLDAPPERIFAAWTDPALLRRRFAAEPDWTTPEATTDVRVGGGYRPTTEPLRPTTRPQAIRDSRTPR
jgi:uncharacterized protein YndB with AHSA1/START domain